MMTARKVRGLVVVCAAATMFVWMSGRPASAQKTKPSGATTGDDRGGVRAGGNPVQVVVKMGGKTIAGVTVTFQTAPDAPAVTATTDDNGVATLSLAAGSYTVTASSASGTAQKTISVVDSTSTMYVDLALVPPTP